MLAQSTTAVCYHCQALCHFAKWHHDTMTQIPVNFKIHNDTQNIKLAPVASILNQSSQTRCHFKAENLFFPTMYKSWWFTMILICELMQISGILMQICMIYRYLQRGDSQLKMVPCLWKSVKNLGHRSYFNFLCVFMYFKIHWNLCHDVILQNDIAITMSDLFENHWESISDLFENHIVSMRINFRLNHWESLRITENQFQTYSRITKNLWESLRITESQWESISRITENQFQTYSRIIENHQESLRIKWESILRITKNHWESMRINFENHQESISDYLRIIKNHWESSRITEDQWESILRITENQQESISDLFENHWESISDLFKNHQNHWESMRINFENHQESISDLFENHCESPRIIKNHQ